MQLAHVIREIRQFQQTPYAFDLSRRVVDYLLDPRNVLEEEELYNRSLEVEPRYFLLAVF